HGPYQATQFATDQAKFDPSVLSTDPSKSPYATWNKVFIPYCTGDVHSGSNVASYTDGSTTDSWHHVGHANVLAYLKRVVPTFTNVGELVVSGSRGGGYGAFFNYATIRDAFPKAKGWLVDDAGPPFPPAVVSQSIRDAFAGSWGSAATAQSVCAECATDW